MDEFAQKVFDRITSKTVDSLNKDEIGFVRARRSYLSDEQKEKFAKILKEEKEAKPKKAK